MNAGKERKVTGGKNNNNIGLRREKKSGKIEKGRGPTMSLPRHERQKESHVEKLKGGKRRKRKKNGRGAPRTWNLG